MAINGRKNEGPNSDEGAPKKINGKVNSNPAEEPMYVTLWGKRFLRLEGDEFEAMRNFLNKEMTREESEVRVILEQCDPETMSVSLRVELDEERDVDVWFWEPTFNPARFSAIGAAQAVMMGLDCDDAATNITEVLDDTDGRRRIARDRSVARELTEPLKAEILMRWKLREQLSTDMEALTNYQGDIPPDAMIWISGPNCDEVD